MGALYRTHALAQENKRENRRGSKERALDNQLSLKRFGSTCSRPRYNIPYGVETTLGCHAQKSPVALIMQNPLRTIYRRRDVAHVRLKTKLNRVGGLFS